MLSSQIYLSRCGGDFGIKITKNMPETKTSFDISFISLFRIVLVGLLVWFVYRTLGIFELLFLAIILASVISPWATYLERFHIPRIVSIIFIYVALFIALFVVVYLLMPTFLQETAHFLNLVSNLSFVTGQDKLFSHILTTLQSDNSFVLSQNLSSLGGSLSQISTTVFDSVVRIFGGLLSFAVVIVISVYLSLRKNGINYFLRLVSPAAYEAKILDIWRRSEDKITRWFGAQLILSSMIGVMVWFGLLMLHVPFSMLLGLLAAILELVPFVGPVIAAIPAVLLGLGQSPELALFVVLLYILVQQIEVHILVPNLMKKAVGMDPVIAILALLIGFQLAGMLGIVMAIPVMVIIIEAGSDIINTRKSRIAQRI